jgi:regulator of protease activity HflC (stomatin/prohibitin superfamily)
VSVIVVIIAAIAVVGIAFLIGAVKIVRPYQRGLVERLGRYKITKEPGFNLILPFIETMRLVDMREQVVDVPPQEVITSDNVVVSVDAVVYYEATDPQRLVYNVADFFTAITKLAQTNLRNLIGDIELDKALTSRDTINAQLRAVLDDATDKWGVKVVRVEIQRIDPPPEVVSAMHAQMRAERDRRATVTEARRRREAVLRPRRRGSQAGCGARRRGRRAGDRAACHGRADSTREARSGRGRGGEGAAHRHQGGRRRQRGVDRGVPRGAATHR